jgi:hypothetical protein
MKTAYQEAMRIALAQMGACNVRCAQLVIDEGFAALDSRNITSVPKLLHEGLLDSGRYSSVLLHLIKKKLTESIRVHPNNLLLHVMDATDEYDRTAAREEREEEDPSYVPEEESEDTAMTSDEDDDHDDEEEDEYEIAEIYHRLASLDIQAHRDDRLRDAIVLVLDLMRKCEEFWDELWRCDDSKLEIYCEYLSKGKIRLTNKSLQHMTHQIVVQHVGVDDVMLQFLRRVHLESVKSRAVQLLTEGRCLCERAGMGVFVGEGTRLAAENVEIRELLPL